MKRINESSNEFALFNDLNDIKRYLAILAGKGETSANDNLFLQFPESTANMYLAASGTFTRERTIQKTLKSLTVYAPADVLIVLKNNDNTFAWFSDQAGNEEFSSGIYIDRLRIEVTNADTANTKRWYVSGTFV